MRKAEFTLALYDEGEKPVRDLKVEFIPVGDGKHQPVVTVNDAQTGASTITRLPISDYTALSEKLDKSLAKLDPQTLPKLAKRIVTALSWLS